MALSATADGGFLLAGYSNTCISGDKTTGSEYCGFYDYWVVKVNGLGNKVWDRTFFRNGLYHIYLQDMVATADGGFLLGGYTKAVKQDPTVSYFVLKINSQGTEIWQKIYGDDSLTISRLRDLAATPDGNYLLAGYTADQSFEGGVPLPEENRNHWLVKIDETGNQLSEQTFRGNDEDFLQAIIPATDGGFY